MLLSLCHCGEVSLSCRHGQIIPEGHSPKEQTIRLTDFQDCDKNLRNIDRKLREKPGHGYFYHFRIYSYNKKHPNHIAGLMTSVREPLKLPPSMSLQKSLSLQWTQKNMTLNDINAILDWSDSWVKVWVCCVDECHRRLQREQLDGRNMLWAGIIEDRLLGTIRVSEEFKVDSNTYCNLLKNI